MIREGGYMLKGFVSTKCNIVTKWATGYYVKTIMIKVRTINGETKDEQARL